MMIEAMGEAHFGVGLLGLECLSQGANDGPYLDGAIGCIYITLLKKSLEFYFYELCTFFSILHQ